MKLIFSKARNNLECKTLQLFQNVKLCSCFRHPMTQLPVPASPLVMADTTDNKADEEVAVATQPLTLKGTHGTCVSFAADIKLHGFNIGPGRRGRGAYFWSYSNTAKDYATCLAKAWWKHAESAKQYQSAVDRCCRVLDVDIEVEENAFLDLEAHAVKQRLVPFLNDVYKRVAAAEHKHLAAKAYDLFVERTEKAIARTIKVVHVTANPPRREHFPHECARVLPSEACVPSCYVVRDKNNIRQIR
jgi:hypothetical protein